MGESRVAMRAAAAAGSLAIVVSGCDSGLPKYTYTFTNDCGFPVLIGMIVDGQGSVATGPIQVYPESRRKLSVFSESESAKVTLIVDTANRVEGDLNTREFAVGVGDVEHAPDPSRPFEITIESELCEGLG